jgi:hypothetical protein
MYESVLPTPDADFGKNLVRTLFLLITSVTIASWLSFANAKSGLHEQSEPTNHSVRGVSMLPPPSKDWVVVPGEQAQKLSGNIGMRHFSKCWKPHTEGSASKIGTWALPGTDDAVSLGPFSGLPGASGAAIQLALGFQSKHGSVPDRIVGFNGDGDTGSLWWISTDGNTVELIIREMIKALFRTGDRILVVVGNGHEGKLILLRSDAVFRRPDVVAAQLIDGSPVRYFQQHDGSVVVLTRESLWLVGPKGREISRLGNDDEFKGIPRSVTSSAERGLLVLTTRGIWQKATDRKPEKICDLNIDLPSNAQIHAPFAEGPNGELLVGLSYHFARIEVAQGKCTAKWFVPASCPEISFDSNVCQCVVGPLAKKPCQDIWK